MYKQIIIARKDLHMSPGKLAAQISHGSMAFLTWMIRNNTSKTNSGYYQTHFLVKRALYEEWLNGSFTKCVLQAKNKNHLLKAKAMAEEMGMVEGIDFFCIYDECRTELTPETIDEKGVGKTLTCIGFLPMDSEIIDKIARKYHLYV